MIKKWSQFNEGASEHKDISSTVVGIIEKMTTEDNFSENISAAEALLARIRKLK